MWMRQWGRSRPAPGLALDVLAGLLAGGVGTALMSPVVAGLTRLQRPAYRQWEAEVSHGSAVQRLVRQVAVRVGLLLPPRVVSRVDRGLHWGAGAAWGAVHALKLRHRGGRSVASGLALGAVLWLLGDEVLMRSLRLIPPPEAFPLSTHLKGLGGRLAYGVAMDGALRGMRSALA